MSQKFVFEDKEQQDSDEEQSDQEDANSSSSDDTLQETADLATEGASEYSIDNMITIDLPFDYNGEMGIFDATAPSASIDAPNYTIDEAKSLYIDSNDQLNPEPEATPGVKGARDYELSFSSEDDQTDSQPSLNSEESTLSETENIDLSETSAIDSQNSSDNDLKLDESVKLKASPGVTGARDYEVSVSSEDNQTDSQTSLNSEQSTLSEAESTDSNETRTIDKQDLSEGDINLEDSSSSLASPMITEEHSSSSQIEGTALEQVTGAKEETVQFSPKDSHFISETVTEDLASQTQDQSEKIKQLRYESDNKLVHDDQEALLEVTQEQQQIYSNIQHQEKLKSKQQETVLSSKSFSSVTEQEEDTQAIEDHQDVDQLESQVKTIQDESYSGQYNAVTADPLTTDELTQLTLSSELDTSTRSTQEVNHFLIEDDTSCTLEGIYGSGLSISIQTLLSSQVQSSFLKPSTLLSSHPHSTKQHSFPPQSLLRQVLDALAEAQQRKNQHLADPVQAQGNQQPSSVKSSHSTSHPNVTQSESESATFNIEDPLSSRVPAQYSLETHQKALLTFNPDENGIWYHLAYHVPELRYAGTALLLDSLIRSKEDKDTLANSIAENRWSDVKSIMHNCAIKANINLDRRILKRISHLVRQSCRIVLLPLQVNAYLSIKSSHREYDQTFYHYTEIWFNTVSPVTRKFQSISTKSPRAPIIQTTINLKLFENINRWNKVIKTKMKTDPPNIEYPLIPVNSFRTEYDFPRVLPTKARGPFTKEEQIIRNLQKIVVGGDRVKGLDYYSWQKKIFPNSVEVKKSKETKTVTIKFCIERIIDTINTGKRPYIRGKITVQIHLDIFNDLKNENCYEKSIEILIGQDGIFEGLLSLMGNYKEGDLFILRNQVSTIGNLDVKINNKLNRQKYGLPDSSPINRHPDYVALVYRFLSTNEEININIIDIKRNLEEFEHSSTKHRIGYGRGQPLRDYPWFNAKIKAVFPNFQPRPIKVSCFSLTAHLDKKEKDTIVILGQQLISQVPAEKVMKYAGLQASRDSQVYEQVKGIYNTNEED